MRLHANLRLVLFCFVGSSQRFAMRAASCSAALWLALCACIAAARAGVVDKPASPNKTDDKAESASRSDDTCPTSPFTVQRVYDDENVPHRLPPTLRPHHYDVEIITYLGEEGDEPDNFWFRGRVWIKVRSFIKLIPTVLLKKAATSVQAKNRLWGWRNSSTSGFYNE